MAIDLTLKSAAITNREASPAVLNNPGAGGVSRLRQVYSLLASVPASLSATSIIRLVEVPSNAIVTSVLLNNGAQGAGAGDIGIYKSNKDGGTVVDADFFGSAVSFAAAVLGTEQMHESTVYTFAKQAQPLWQALGLSADPKITYDIAVTITTDITTGTGALGIRASYVQ
jgi:hypothetical protein